MKEKTFADREVGMGMWNFFRKFSCSHHMSVFANVIVCFSTYDPLAPLPLFLFLFVWKFMVPDCGKRVRDLSDDLSCCFRNAPLRIDTKKKKQKEVTFFLLIEGGGWVGTKTTSVGQA